MPRKPREFQPCRLCGDLTPKWRWGRRGKVPSVYCSKECRDLAFVGNTYMRDHMTRAAVREGELIEQALTKLERKTTNEDMEEKSNGK